MKVRYLKRRAQRPTFRMTRVRGTLHVQFNSPDAVPRFFGPTAEDNRRAAEFFGISEALPESVG
jgi:hypothetical protein